MYLCPFQYDFSSIPMMDGWPLFLSLFLFTARSGMFHACFHYNFKMSVKLYVSIFWIILMDLVSNLTVNLGLFSAHVITAPMMPCSGQDIPGGDAWMSWIQCCQDPSIHAPWGDHKPWILSFTWGKEALSPSGVLCISQLSFSQNPERLSQPPRVI